MRVTHLDFVPAPAPLRLWRLAICAVGLTAVAIAGGNWLVQYNATKAVEAQLTITRPAPINKPQRSSAQQRVLEAQASVIVGAVRQLNLPIGELITVLHPPKDIHVALLGLDVGSNAAKGSGEITDSATSAGLLKITAESQNPQEMMSYVAFLGEQKIFKSVYLIKHELNSASSPASYRFQLEAQWQK